MNDDRKDSATNIWTYTIELFIDGDDNNDEGCYINKTSLSNLLNLFLSDNIDSSFQQYTGVDKMSSS